VGEFPLDNGLTMPNRIASFLDWWATRHPYDFAAYNEICKAVQGYERLPRLDTEEVEQIRGTVGRAEPILHQKYQRALVRNRGLGARATVDDVDVIRNKQGARAKRVERSIVALAHTDELIDTRRIPDSPQNRELKQWYARDVKSILKQVSGPEFLAKMLPPKSKKDGEE
jgi:hypothetical protein